MQFGVCYKGMQKYVGQLDAAIAYIAKQWGSVARAYEIGVKLKPLP